MNDFGPYADVFDGVAPFRGDVPKGFLVNPFGSLTDANFRVIWGVVPDEQGGRVVETRLPAEVSGEDWFEFFNCVESAREARGRYVMMTLGACYGGQAVDCYKAVKSLNPMPVKLVAVDAVPENVVWTRKNFADNGIAPDEYWLLQAAMGASNEPVIFPDGSPGFGAQNAIATNCTAARLILAEQITGAGKSDTVVKNLMLTNSTGIEIDLDPSMKGQFVAELRFVSALTLDDLLAPFDRVDYVEADLQQSEAIVFPPAMAQLNAKVRRVHLGTHGDDIHQKMQDLFAANGWQILFSFPGNRRHQTPYGNFDLNDGVLSAVNPAVAYG